MGEGVGEGVGDSVGDSVGEGVGEGVVGAGVGDSVGEGEGSGVGESVGDGVVGAGDGDGVGEGLGAGVVGAGVVGDNVGLGVGAGVGAALTLQDCGMGKSIANKQDVDSDIEKVEGPDVDAVGSQVKSTATAILVPSGQFLSPLWSVIETPPVGRVDHTGAPVSPASTQRAIVSHPNAPLRRTSAV